MKLVGRLFIYGSILLFSVFFAIICATTQDFFKLGLCIVSALIISLLIIEEIHWQIKKNREKEHRSEPNQTEEDVPEELRARVEMKKKLEKEVGALEDLKKTLPQKIKKAEEELEEIEEELEEDLEKIEKRERQKAKEAADAEINNLQPEDMGAEDSQPESDDNDAKPEDIQPKNE